RAQGGILGVAGEAQATVSISSAPPQLTNVLPAIGAQIGSEEVLFSWRSNTPGSSTLHLRPQDGDWTTYSLSPNDLDPTLFTTSVPLDTGTYEWWGEISSECGVTTTGSATTPNLVEVAQSVSFHNREYAFTVSDDYDQTRDVLGMAMLVRI